MSMKGIFKKLLKKSKNKIPKILRVKISREVVEGILEACRNVHPQEFVGLLRAEKDTITEVILPPASVYGEGAAQFNPYMLPFDFSIIGSVHSHPSGWGKPSIQDLNSMFNFGFVHIIVTFPYHSYQNLHFYDKKGKNIQYEIVD
ncbi:MAG: Mov34/MPN/PAD-1 family protein [Candidatus Freyarchaeota archaeon]